MIAFNLPSPRCERFESDVLLRSKAISQRHLCRTAQRLASVFTLALTGDAVEFAGVQVFLRCNARADSRTPEVPGNPSKPGRRWRDPLPAYRNTRKRRRSRL